LIVHKGIFYIGERLMTKYIFPYLKGEMLSIHDFF